MQKIFAGVTALGFIVALSGPAFAKTETVTGQLVDLSCYTMDKANTTVAHKGMGETCAEACAKKGQPVALVTSDGKVYQVAGELAAEKNAKLVGHMSHTVEITGDVTMAGDKMTITSGALKMVKK